MKIDDQRLQLLDLCAAESIGDTEAGEPEWQAYLTSQQLGEAIVCLRPHTAGQVAAILSGEGHA